MTHTVDEPNEPRGRGRPAGTTKVPPGVLAEVWVQVFMARVRGRRLAGKTPKVSRACRDIVDRGGLVSVVGGNRDAVAEANARSEKAWHRFEWSYNGQLHPAAGTIYASHAITNAGTLAARYSQAKLFVVDSRVRLVWMNLVRQRLGLPLKHQGSDLRRKTRAFSPVTVVYRPPTNGRN